MIAKARYGKISLYSVIRARYFKWGAVPTWLENCWLGYVRNEFHFSDVHGAINQSGSRSKWMKGVHVSFAHYWTSEKLNSLLIQCIYINFSHSLVEKLSRQTHLQANREFTHSVCSNSGMASWLLQCPITMMTPMVFYDVKLHRDVVWHDVVLETINRISFL